MRIPRVIEDIIMPEEVEEVFEKFGVFYSEDQKLKLQNSLPGKETLQKASNHVLVPEPPELTDERLSEKNPFSSCLPKIKKDVSGWSLIQKSPVEGSTFLRWDQQIRLLGTKEYVPTTVEMAWLISLYYEIKSVLLFSDVHVRTAKSKTNQKYSGAVISGYKGFNIEKWSEEQKASCIGLSAALSF